MLSRFTSIVIVEKFSLPLKIINIHYSVLDGWKWFWRSWGVDAFAFLCDNCSVTRTYFENLVRALENGLSDVDITKGGQKSSSSSKASGSSKGRGTRAKIGAVRTGASSRGGDESGHWSCEHCTYANTTSTSACIVCSYRRSWSTWCFSIPRFVPSAPFLLCTIDLSTELILLHSGQAPRWCRTLDFSLLECLQQSQSLRVDCFLSFINRPKLYPLRGCLEVLDNQVLRLSSGRTLEVSPCCLFPTGLNQNVAILRESLT